MHTREFAVAQQVAEAARVFQQQTTGHTSKAVSVVQSNDTLVITMFEAMTPAEQAMAVTEEGAAYLQEYYQYLFATSSLGLTREISRITGRRVREATAKIEPATGCIVHAFTTGAMVQVVLLAPYALAKA